MASRGLIKEVIDSWNTWFQNSSRSFLPRKQEWSVPDWHALAIIGVRRSGKSFVGVNLLQHYPSVFVMNFEDPFFIENNTIAILDELISVFTQFSQQSPQYLLLDEIHNLSGWERWVRKMVDLKRYHIVVTGSSAKMLSMELATSLTGRSLTQTVWPLSFQEYCVFRKIRCQNADEYLGALRVYALWGGFPEVALTDSIEVKKLLLKQYFMDILYKDIIKRNEIRTPRNLEILAHYYLTHVSCSHSYNSIRKAFDLNIETARDYTGYLQDAFLVFEVNRYHPNLKVQVRDAKKIYTIDTGMRNIIAPTANEDLGRLMENLVYLQLRRLNREIYYFKETGKVDFLVTEQGKPSQAIQVCYDDSGNEKTWEREISSMIECLERVGLNQGLILSQKREEKINVKNRQIWIRPLYQWLSE